MRRVSIAVICDCCEEQVEEETEGALLVRLTARGQEKEIDLCDDCLYGTFLQEARPVGNRRQRKSVHEGVACDICGKSYKNERGLATHRTRMH